MSFLPKSTAEVKQILTVRDLQTEQCSGFLAGDHSLCPWPVFSGKWADGKNGDAGSLVDCVEISALPFEDPGASPEPQVIYRRSVQDKDPLNLWLQIAKTRAKAAERAKDPAFKSAALPDPDPPRGPLKPAKKQGRVVPFPKTKESKAHPNKRPADVVKYASKIKYAGGAQDTYHMLYALSMYINGNTLDYWPYKHDRKGRFYLKGNYKLEEMTGYSKRTIVKHLNWLRLHGFINKIYKGQKGKANSIWEVPKNKEHVFTWKRNPKHKTK